MVTHRINLRKTTSNVERHPHIFHVASTNHLKDVKFSHLIPDRGFTPCCQTIVTILGLV